MEVEVPIGAEVNVNQQPADQQTIIVEEMPMYFTEGMEGTSRPARVVCQPSLRVSFEECLGDGWRSVLLRLDGRRWIYDLIYFQ